MGLYINGSWSRRLNPVDRINKKPEDQKNDHMTKNTKNHKAKKIEPIIWPNFHLLNFDVLSCSATKSYCNFLTFNTLTLSN